MKKLNNGLYDLESSKDSPFSYHLYLKSEIEKAIADKTLQKYHMNFARNIFEKLSTFLGYQEWPILLPPESDYEERILNLYSHSKHSAEESSTLTDNDKKKIEDLIDYLNNYYHFYNPNHSTTSWNWHDT